MSTWSRLLGSVVLGLVLTLGCSKKDVKEEEPLMSATEPAPAPSSPPVESTQSAGDVGTPAADLRPIYFEYDRFTIQASSRDILKENASWLKANPTASVQIEGHCDERGTTEYNLALGERRANAVRDYLVRLGVAKSRVSVISYGKERPVDPGHDESAWAKNRRAVFVVTSH